MQSAITITSLVSLMARAQRMDKAEQNKLHRLIRYLVTQNIIPKLEEVADARGTHAFDLMSACIVGLLTGLNELEVSPRGLRNAASFLQRKPELPGKVSLEGAVSAIRNGDDAFFVIFIMERQGTRDRRPLYEFLIERNSEVPDEQKEVEESETASILNSHAMAFGVKRASVLQMSANQFLEPILSAEEWKK